MQEIERKFLVKELPDLSKFQRHQIKQTYLSFEPEVRIRRCDTQYYFTVKTNGDLQRTEFEVEISSSEYCRLLEDAITKTIKKTRFKHDIYELDIYHDLDLVIVEVEFPTVEEAENFVVPTWFGKEVTYDKEFKNKNLAKMLGGKL